MANEIGKQHQLNQNIRKLLLTKSAISKDPRKHVERYERSGSNYERRSHQYSQCGYRAPITQPYQELGEVILDDQELIIKGLGQEGWKLDTEVSVYKTVN